MTRVYSLIFYLSVTVIIAVLLAGCEPGTETMPKPREVCTAITGEYACGRGGTCQQCGKWVIGCPEPLELRQEPQFQKDEPRLVCRMKDASNVLPQPEASAPLR